MTMSNMEVNKDNARAFFDCFIAQDFDTVSHLLAEDIIYTMPGKFPFAGTLKGRMAYLDQVIKRFQGHVSDAKMDILQMTAEDNRVAIEAVGHFQFKDGILYENNYHFLFHFDEDSKIKKMVEYMDTYSMTKTFSV
jgi:uncharacterized protein